MYFSISSVVSVINCIFSLIMPHPFRTIIKPEKPPFTISHQDRIMTIGSCFSEHIGQYFGRYKFHININPFGQQYNPYSISNAINRLLSRLPYTEADLIQQDELYHSYDYHGDFSKAGKEETLTYINTNLSIAAEALKQTSVLFLTFGTSHYFRLRESGKVVSNCHKVPGRAFDFELMKPDEIVHELENSLTSLWGINPAVKVILTVSPVRYFAFGHYENSVSKAHLFTAIHALREKYPQLYYFPAYELVMDDLRDYRFFADDMLHPGQQAISYVWESMAQTLLPASTHNLLKELDEIISAANHRPRNPQSQVYKKFIENTLTKIQNFSQKTGLDLDREVAIMRKTDDKISLKELEDELRNKGKL
jgi:hypothetical protein